MNYQIYIENLGAIEKADLIISPLSIIAGENGTGKSFVTKFLYSILNVAITDLYFNELNDVIHKVQSNLLYFIKNEDFAIYKEEIGYLIEINNFLNKLENMSLEMNIPFNVFAFEHIVKLEEYVNVYKNNLQRILESFKSDKDDVNNENFSSSFLKIFKFFSPKHKSKSIGEDLSNLLSLIKDPQNSYLKIVVQKLEDELKENFQISELKLLITSNKDKAIFKIDELIHITIFPNNSINVEFEFEKILNIFEINRIVFFESPVYWKLLSLISNQPSERKKYLSKNISEQLLEGVPKHFIDLKELLFTNFKDGERPDFIVEVADDLARHLKGKFHANNNDLTFENDKGQTIPKSLVSFGMTNLGILQAVLSKNIINVGSFIFIDEPESNLHPAWQNILAETLVKLAENGVFVVITTHSTDMLKAFDIITQEKQKANDTKIKYDFLSTYYFQNDGLLLDTSNSELSPIEQARQKLLEPYDNMMVRGYLL